jgi:hypothetical protein
MGKKPLIGMVGFFGLSLALAGCSDNNYLSKENVPPWKTSLTRNSAKDQGWKDAPKSDENAATVAATDLGKSKSPVVDAGKGMMNDAPPTTAYRMPGAGGAQPLSGAYPTEAGPGSSSPVVNSSTMRLPDDGLKGQPMSAYPTPVVRENIPQAKAPAALEEPSLPPTRSLPTIKGASSEAVVPPPPPPVSMDPSLSAPPPPLPVGVAPSGSNLPEAPTMAPPAPPTFDPVPPPPAPPPG